MEQHEKNDKKTVANLKVRLKNLVSCRCQQILYKIILGFPYPAIIGREGHSSLMLYLPVWKNSW
jgi:hypothetical protein